MAVHGEGMLDMLCIVEDAVGHASKQDKMGELGVYCGYSLVVRQ